MKLRRREFIGLGAGLAWPLLGNARAASGQPFTVTVCGQALMTHLLCAEPYPGFGEVVAELRRGDAVFTGLEAPVLTERSGAPTRTGQFLHQAPAGAPACLREMGFNLVALANNHAYDLGTAGILATLDAVRAAGLAAAGTGADLAAAAAPGYLEGGRRVALVAMAIGKIAEGGAATAERPGVNEVRMDGAAPAEPDVRRVLASITTAAARSDLVIVYLSNHEWGEDRALTKEWARLLARRCIEAGADVYVTHGAPMLHGIELHQGRPILHGLGSLVFHSRTPIGYYPPEVWESAIVHIRFSGRVLREMEVVPVALNEAGDDPARQLETRGRPRLAAGQQSTRILQRLGGLSAALGTTLDTSEGRLSYHPPGPGG